MSVSSGIALTGPVTVLTGARLTQQGLDAIRSGQARIDLSGVTVADSTALAAILAWMRAGRERGVQVEITNIPSNIRSLAAVYGVADLLP